MDTYEVILKATAKRGIHAGIHCGKPEYAVRMHKMGFNLITLSNDSGILLNAAKAAVATTRAG